MAKHSNDALNYIRKLYAPQDALLRSIDERLHAAGLPIHIGPEEGKLLQLLIRMSGTRRIVEIGTLAGYSTVWMARVLPEDGHIFTLNRDKNHIALAKETFAACDVTNRITMLEGDAHDILPRLSERGPFDMLFIDADKISYPKYLDWAQENIRTGGLIIADNTLLGGGVYMDEIPEGFTKNGIAPTTLANMRAFNERIADSRYFESVMLPTAEGLTIAIKK